MKIIIFAALGFAGLLLAASPRAASLIAEEQSTAKDAPTAASKEAEPAPKESRTPKKKPAAKGEENKPDKSIRQSGVHIEMVELPSGIFLGKYEVTQGQWQAVMGRNPSVFVSCGDNCPVEVVSWDDVQKFIKKLNSQTGKNYRLPSEEEWQAACKAGNKDEEYCGSGNIDAVAWYKGNSGESIHPVGHKQPNAYGLHDMSGNVSEWTNSCNEGKCSRRIYVGGSYMDEPAFVRANAQPRIDTTYRGFLYLGFRLALDP